MRIAVLANNLVALPALEYLISQGLLAGLGIPDVEHDATQRFGAMASHYGVPLARFARQNLASSLKRWLSETRPDMVFVMTFPFKLPAPVLDGPQFGFFNFHPGLLPHYRGPDPIFWQIRNQERWGGLCIHRMEAEFDTGPIVHVEKLEILPQDTFGLHLVKLGPVFIQGSWALLTQLSSADGELTPERQDPAQAAFHPKPQAADLTIDWSTQSAGAIDALCRASNPFHGGAITFWRNIPLRPLQVTVQDSPPLEPLAVPGTVTTANPRDGVTVSSSDGRQLRLDILRTEEGVFTGGRFAALSGLCSGEVLSG